ncbi:hypothetical protein NXH64_08650 [Butyrivibrio fibrisolvens]|uniref:hypothetical protein n=1 Tax=Pseudobutyrivibrio ruminis TaxID=46206 RepID=UPI0012DC3241|nr:hypothetical protein [Pseudobutyrivibrio ruminis]MDC7279568.1 hypothetical protein [Butyrivibrio fibrisolvens]
MEILVYRDRKIYGDLWGFMGSGHKGNGRPVDYDGSPIRVGMYFLYLVEDIKS